MSLKAEKLQVTSEVERYGQVTYNDGQFAEVQLIGMEGLESGLLLETIQLHREETDKSTADFLRELPCGTRLHVSITTEVTRIDEYSAGAASCVSH
jgi:hypothetical protein